MYLKSLAAIVALAAIFGFIVDRPSQDATPTIDVPSAASEFVANDRSNTFKIDSGHSGVLFRVLHMGAGPFWGRFNDVSGSFKLDPKNAKGNFVKVEIKTASVDSNSKGRDAHLMRQDFFSAKEFPKITFESTKVTADGDDFMIEGKLTLRGVTKNVKTKAKHFGTANINRRFGLRSGYEAELNIKRSDFGVNYGIKGNALGNDVRIVIALEGMIAK